ncbi:MAG: hypothetical protein NVS1B4_24590 [Gemmatimonadaceae bacterium]
MTTPPPASGCDPRAPHCHVCSDDATVGRIVDIDPFTRTATVDLPDGRATVAMDLVDARVGDEILVQLGFALARVGTP